MRDDLRMVETVIDLGRYLGMPVKPSPYLPNGVWQMWDGCIWVALDLWEDLQIPIFDFELLTDAMEDEDEESRPAA